MKKSVSILGISGLYHDSAAALLVDGKIVYAAQEERFTRKKENLACNVARQRDILLGRYTLESTISLLILTIIAIIMIINTWKDKPNIIAQVPAEQLKAKRRTSHGSIRPR